WAEWSGGDGSMVAVDPTNGQRGYGLWGQPVYTGDGGVAFNWSDVSPSLPGDSDLAVESSGNGYLSGQTNLYPSTNPGVSFSPFFTTRQNISSIAMSLADTSIIWLSLSDGSVTKVTINQGTPTGQNYTIPGAIPEQSPSLAVDQTNANRVVAV